MSIIISPAILRRLPSNEEEASALVNEILEQALAIDEDPQHQLENRPDLQASIEVARKQIEGGNIVAMRMFYVGIESIDSLDCRGIRPLPAITIQNTRFNRH